MPSQLQKRYDRSLTEVDAYTQVDLGYYCWSTTKCRNVHTIIYVPTCFPVAIFQGTIITILQVKLGTYWHVIRDSIISTVKHNPQNNNYRFAKTVLFTYAVIRVSIVR